MKKVTIIIVLTIMTFYSYAQEAADKKYNKGKYKSAISIYKKFLSDEENKYNVHAIRGLAMSYKAVKKYADAESMFRKLIVLDTSFNDLLHYSEVLLENKKYEEANKLIVKNNLSVRNNKSVNLIETSIKNITQMVSLDTGNIKVLPMPINAKHPEFSAFNFQDGIVYSSSKKYSLFSKSFVEKSFFASNLYFSSSKTNFSKSTKFAKEIRIKGNAGPASYCAKNRTLYYSVNYTPNSTIVNSKNIRIHSAYLNIDNSKWVTSTAFPFNSKEYSCMHPTITADGNAMFFVSNMPGGYGGMDVYLTTYVDSRWTKPVNLGPNVNTESDELFPFIDNNSQLYFSTKGRGGIGGLDIFVFDLNAPNTAAENLGAPFNSSSDDFGFFKSNIADKGYFSSSRGKAYNDFDVYSYVRTKPIVKKINALVVDSKNNLILNSANLNLDVSKNNEHTTYTSTNGKIEKVEVSLGDILTLTANAKNYISNNIQVTVNRVDTAYNIPLTAQKTGCKLSGEIKSLTTNEGIANAKVIISNSKNLSLPIEIFTDSDGKFNTYSLQKNINYDVKAVKEGYFSKSLNITTGDDCDNTIDLSSNYTLNFNLISGKVSTMENIYFDLNKSIIREDAKVELNKLVDLMRDNPEIVIEISSHTDARGSDALNMKLSEKRSQAAVDYIVSKGIAQNRLKAKGYGETKIINNCINDFKCTEEEHQKNRRTEFQVVGIL